MFFFLLGFLCFGGAVFLVGELATAPARARQTAVRRAATYGKVQLRGAEMARFGERVVTPLARRIARLVLRVNRKTTMESVSLKLLAAGMRISPTSFLAGKGFFAAGGVVLGFVVGVAGSAGGMAVLLTLLLAGVGYLLPDFVVNGRIRSRRERIRAELPDALDLLAVSVEAGLGFDGAVAKLTEYMDGPLTEEFGLALGEMRIGESRENALKKMVARVETPELSAFVRAIIQADQLGISLGRILRVQAADTRLRRQAAAEEKAMKAPIKMLFPTVGFIFPAMFLVILGPAFMNFFKIF